MRNSVYILSAYRTPIGSFNGSLASLSSTKLLSHLVPKLCSQAEIDTHAVEMLYAGNVLQAGQGQNIARLVARETLSQHCTAHTINMVCGSGLKAVISATQAIRCQDAQVIIAGGTESMSQSPYLIPKARQGFKMGHQTMIDSMIQDGLWDVLLNYHMGITAENIAKHYSISRNAQDEFSVQSQRKAAQAIQNNRFSDEIIPISIPQRKGDSLIISDDEFPKPSTTIDSLSSLRPVFQKEGTVTAGNASGINDGAAAIVLASETFVALNRCSPLAKIVSYAEVGIAPEEMGMGPAKAIPLALQKAGWKKEDVDLFEINEAFAAQSIAVINELSLPYEKINVNGGAIALGHPIGASGTRILVTLIHELKRQNLKRGCVSLCIGGGMGIAACIELV